MKNLPPTMRNRKRYLAFELISEESVTREELIKEIFSCAGSLIGDLGSSECNIRLLSFENSKGIIRCNHNTTEKTRASLATVTNIGGKQAVIHILGISGTVKGATTKYLKGFEVFNPKGQSYIKE
ncbi:MAG: Rpp14/Pop5 family protein [Methanohalobium sp.]|uniref:Rpp14/Pop5 family protein n=1 Tax=Methanohalobium sp. TaxID=2837493 RepID=UPI00397C8766